MPYRHQQARRTSSVPIKAPTPSAWSLLSAELKRKSNVPSSSIASIALRPASCSLPKPTPIATHSSSSSRHTPVRQYSQSFATSRRKQGTLVHYFRRQECSVPDHRSGHEAPALNFAIRSNAVCAPLRSSGSPSSPDCRTKSVCSSPPSAIRSSATESTIPPKRRPPISRVALHAAHLQFIHRVREPPSPWTANLLRLSVSLQALSPPTRARAESRRFEVRLQSEKTRV